MINTNELLARLLGQTSPNEDIAKTIAAQTFPSGSFGRAQLAAPVGAPAPPPQAPAPAVPDLPAVQEVADKPLVGTEYAPPQPAPAPAPAAAPVARGQAPDFSPSFAQKMMNFGDNLNGKGSDLGEQSKSRTKTFEMLRGWGLDDATAEFAARNPAVLQSMFAARHGNTRTDDLREYDESVRQGYKGTFVDFKRETKRTNQPIIKDGGTHWIHIDPSSGEVVNTIPKDVQGAAAAKERGKNQGEAQVNLPVVELNARKITELVDGVLADKDYIPSMTGPIDSRLPNVSEKATRLQARIDQIQNKAFLVAFEGLRGGGAITEAEGKKATGSLNRLSAMDVGDRDYIAALEEFKRDVQDLVELARRKAAGGQPPPASAAPDTLPAPSVAPGTVRKYNPATGALE
jgi:hypothetical protein